MDTLFYDGHCPLCRREIRLLRRLQQGGLAFTDIHRLPTTDTSLPAADALLRRLHLRDSAGHWHRGLEATVRAWSHTRYGFLFRPLLWPGIGRLARLAYVKWADRRYQQRYRCHVCQPPTSD